MASTRSKSLLRRRPGETGAAFWEGTLGLALFFGLLLTGLDIIRETYTTLGGQFAVNRAARWAALDERLVRNTESGPVVLDRVSSIKQKLIETAAPFGLRPDTADISICPASNLSCTSDEVGAPQQLFRIRLRHQPRLLWRFETLELNLDAFGHNE